MSVIPTQHTPEVANIATDRACAMFEMPAIRTPEQYAAALDRAAQMLASANGEDVMQIPGFQTLSEAIADAPFCMDGREVVSKGFSPRFVA